MASILILETATEMCSVALVTNGAVVAIHEDPPPANHAARITRLIEACMADAGMELVELDAVALSGGPGSYTGLRVGAAAAKGICFALGIPLIAVDTLEGLAIGAREAMPADARDGCVFLPMLDARRNEVWTAAYDAGLQLLAPAEVLLIDNILFENFVSGLKGVRQDARFVLAGNGATKARSGLTVEGVADSGVLQCTAATLAGPAMRKFQNIEFEDISYFEPLYMKAPNITSPRNL